jgi:hypothetical protein
VGVGEKPGPGPKVAVVDDRGAAIEKVSHEASADGGGSYDAGGEQEERDAVLTEIERASRL